MKSLKIIFLSLSIFCFGCDEMKKICFGCDEVKEITLKDKEEVSLEGIYLKEDFIKEVLESKDKILVLKSDFFLNLSGENLILSIAHLKVEEGARIITFKKGSHAEQKISGRDGGIIDLKIDEGEGYLIFEMRGEEGGKRKKSRYDLSLMEGGASGKLRVSFKGEKKLYLEIHLEGGKGGLEDIILDSYKKAYTTYRREFGKVFFPILRGENLNYEIH